MIILNWTLSREESVKLNLITYVYGIIIEKKNKREFRFSSIVKNNKSNIPQYNDYKQNNESIAAVDKIYMSRTTSYEQ